MNMNEPASPRDLLDAIEWSYRLFLGREPESADHVKHHLTAHSTLNDVRRSFMASSEFRDEAAGIATQQEYATLFQKFDVYHGSGETGFWRDFLGVRTRCSYLPADFEKYSGRVFPTPDKRSEDIHDLEEWVGTLRSVSEAKDRGKLVVVELGAGWGPWLVAAAKAAQIAEISDIFLLGVEGAEEHVSFMRQHFADNEIAPDCQRIVHAIVGREDGTARFPRLPKPSDDWGAQAEFGAIHEAENYTETPCLSLDTLLRDIPFVDLIHCDIQGVEGDVLTGSSAILDARVRRVIVGTHSKEVEAQLMRHFDLSGWQMEHSSSCQFHQSDDGAFHLLTDGCQVWRNKFIG